MKRVWNERKHHRDRVGRFARRGSVGDVFARRMSDHIGQTRGEPRRLTSQERDLAVELMDAGGRVHPDGTVTLYHFTTAQAAERIRRTGRMTGQEDGVFFTTRSDASAQAGGRGGGRVTVRVPLHRLVLDDVFGDEAHVRIPTRRAGDTVDVSAYLGRGTQPRLSGRRMSEQVKLATGQDYYHGTVIKGLKEILPGTVHKGPVIFRSDTDPSFAYATPDVSNAWSYAEKAWNATDIIPSVPRVYRVRAVGPVEPDPTVDRHGRQRSNYDTDVRSRWKFVVIEEVPMPEEYGSPEDWR